MKKAVIFDMDGVLVDNSPIHKESFNIFGQKHGLGNIDITEYFGMGNEEILPKIFGREMNSQEVKELSLEKEAIYREIYSKTIAPLPGLLDTLKALNERGIKLAVGSSGITPNVEFVLESCGIKEYFNVIANGDMITIAKPDPEVFLLAAKMLDIAPEDCVVFEDSFAGIKAARSANMKVVAVATTYPKEEHKDYDYLIDDFTQITIEEIIAD